MSVDSGYWTRRTGRVSRRRIMAGTAGAALTAAFLAACSGDSDDSSGGSGSTSSSSAASQTAGGSAGNAIPTGLEKDHPLIAQFHWSKANISTNPPKAGGRLRYPMSDPATWDPTDPTATAASNAWGWMYSRLLKPNGRLADALAGKNNLFQNVSDGDLAASWEQPDQTTYIFKLRDNVFFHDLPPVNGRQMTAQDVKYSFEAYQKPAATAHVSIFRDVKSVEATDDATVKITTNRPVAYLLNSLTSPLTAVFAREAYERPEGLKPAPPIGTGPFIVKDYKQQASLTMDKNPKYFIKDRPYLDGADGVLLSDRASYIAAFRTVQLDYLALLNEDEYKQLEQTERGKMDVHVNQQNNGGVQWHFGMNLELPPWNDVRVRRGMSMALDRPNAGAAIWQAGHNSLGFPTDWLSREYLPRDDEFGQWYEYNPGEAKKLLEAAGVAGTTLKLQAPGTVVPANDMASLALENWKAAGVNVQYEPMDGVAFNSQFFGKKAPGLVLHSNVTSGFDLDDFTFRLMKSGEPANYYNITDPALDELVQAQQRTFDRTERQKIGDQIVEKDLDQIYRLWYVTRYFFEVKRPFVQNFLSHDVYWFSPFWGSSTSVDTWLDK